MKKTIVEMFSIKDKKILDLLHKLLVISYAVCLTGLLILHIFLEYLISFDILKIAIYVFQAGLFMATSSIMSALVINKYRGA